MIDGKKKYREVIYKHYADIFQDTNMLFSYKRADKWNKAYSYYFKELLPKSKNAKILDLACGYGNLLYFFISHNYNNLKGIDISKAQIDMAKKVCKNVEQKDIMDFFSENTEQFDLITGLDIIEHFSKEEAISFLQYCFKSLNKGGRLILQTPNGEIPWGNSLIYNDFTHEVVFTPNSLTRIMKLLGFKNIKCKEQSPIPYNYSFLSSVRYLLWRFLRLFIIFRNLIETGLTGSGVYSRNLIITGIK